MIRRLNHAVLYVRSLRDSVAFYTSVLGFSKTATAGEQMVFLRAAASSNDHDLALLEVGPRPLAPPGTPGLYHLAWQVGTLVELAELRDALAAAGALTGESDHGVSRSIYGKDPDGIEFEVMWESPRESWPEAPFTAPLHLDHDLARYAALDTAC